MLSYRSKLTRFSSPLASAASRRAKLFRRFVDESSSSKVDSVAPQKLPILVKGKSLPEEVRERLPKTADYCFSVTSYSAESSRDVDAEYGECFTILERVSATRFLSIGVLMRR